MGQLKFRAPVEARIVVLLFDLLYSTVVLAVAAGYGNGSKEAGITAVVMFSVIGGFLLFSVPVLICCSQGKCTCTTFTVLVLEWLGLMCYYYGDNINQTMTIFIPNSTTLVSNSTTLRNCRLSGNVLLAFGVLLMVFFPQVIELLTPKQKSNNEVNIPLTTSDNQNDEQKQDQKQDWEEKFAAIIALLVTADALFTAFSEIGGIECTTNQIVADFILSVGAFWVVFSIIIIIVGINMCGGKGRNQQCLYGWGLVCIVLAFGFYLVGDNLQPLVCALHCDDSNDKCKRRLATIRSICSGIALGLLLIPVSTIIWSRCKKRCCN